MNMKAASAIFLAAAVLLLPRIAYSEMTILEEAVEEAQVELLINEDLSGTAVVRPCHSCEPLRFKVTPQTRLIANGKDRPLQAGPARLSKKAVVFYRPEDNAVTRIVWR